MTPVDFKTKLNAYEKLMRLDKPVGTLLLLWPTLWALWVAGYGRPDVATCIIFAMGTLLMRSAGCVINDWADRDFDGHVERTQERPLVTGLVSSKEALLLAGGLALIALGFALFLNRLVIMLTVPAALIAASYPFFKRFFPLPQAWLGLAFSFGIPMAFAAILYKIPPIAWCLLLANTCWTIAYDTEYAMADKPDDIRIGIKTSAITFGRFDAEITMLFHAVFLALMVGIGYALRRGPFWYAGLVGAAVLMAFQYRKIRTRDRQKCFRAFLDNNYVGLVIFCFIAADYYYQLHRYRF